MSDETTLKPVQGIEKAKGFTCASSWESKPLLWVLNVEHSLTGSLMKLLSVLVIAVAVMATLGWAQGNAQPPQTGSNPSAAQAGQSAGAPASSAPAAANGKEYRLQGNKQTVGSLIGPQVEITGEVFNDKAIQVFGARDLGRSCSEK